MRRFSVSVVGRLIAAIFQLFVVASVVRTLGVVEFGVYSVSVSVFLAILAIFELGMGYRVLRGMSAPGSKEMLTTYSIIRFFVLFATIAGVACLGQVGSYQQELIFAVAIYTFGESFGDFAVGITQGFKKSGYASALLITRRVAALAPLLLISGRQGVLTSLWTAGLLGISIFMLFAIRLGAKPVPLVNLLRHNFTLLVSSGALNIAQLDISVVGLALGTKGAGLYGAATRLMNPLNMAISTFVGVAISELASMSSDAQRLNSFRKIQKLTAIFSGLLMAFSWLAPLVTEILFGSEFLDSGGIATAVFISAGFAAITQVNLSWFYALGVPKVLAASLCVSVLVGLASIFLFSRLWGTLGSGLGLIFLNAITCWVVHYIWKNSVKGIVAD